MDDVNGKEYLCLNGENRKYAVDFEYVVEICREMQISRIPCLPQDYIGLCNYKGLIVPVLSQEEFDEEKNIIPLLLILKCGKYYLGLHVTNDLSSVILKEEDRIKSQASLLKEEYLGVTEFYLSKGDLIRVLKVGALVDRLINYAG